MQLVGTQPGPNAIVETSGFTRERRTGRRMSPCHTWGDHRDQPLGNPNSPQRGRRAGRSWRRSWRRGSRCWRGEWRRWGWRHLHWGRQAPCPPERKWIKNRKNRKVEKIRWKRCPPWQRGLAPSWCRTGSRRRDRCALEMKSGSRIILDKVEIGLCWSLGMLAHKTFWNGWGRLRFMVVTALQRLFTGLLIYLMGRNICLEIVLDSMRW